MIRVRSRIREGVSSGLCGSCEYARIMRTKHTDQEQVLCEENHPSMLIRAPLADCSDYQAKGAMALHEMKAVGWVLETKGGKIIGFRPPKKDED